MAMLFVFLFGVANFALHKAVLESGHPLLAQMPWFNAFGGRLSGAVEFLLLAGAMLMIAGGADGWAWAYVVYSVVNGVSVWLILSGRV